MRTAMMMPAPQRRERSSSVSSSKAVDSAIDSYATRVLQSSQASDTPIDTNLGPYIASILRGSEINDQEEVPNLSEFDSLLELLEDQCDMDAENATKALKTIAQAVVTEDFPEEGVYAAPGTVRITKGLFSVNGRSSLDSFQSMHQALPSQLTIDPYTPTAAGGPSPLKPDNLIPVDLLGFLDEPSPVLQQQQQQQQQQQGGFGQQTLETMNGGTPVRFSPPEEQKIANDEAAFPPLGGADTSTSTSKSPGESAFPPLGSSSKQNGSKKIKMKSKGSGKGKSVDKELAAALFRPSRPRQNSIIDEESSPKSTSQPAPANGLNGMANSQNNHYFQQQLDSCVEILLSMNSELSEEAASAAGLMANLDFNMAQYLIDSAMTAPPICRHMLHDGCYRSDCQFSHDVEGHTCLFWIRGRCSKGSSCKFLHGFNSKLLEGIEQPADQSNTTSASISIATPNRNQTHNNEVLSASFQSPPLSSSMGGFGGLSPAASSWHSPSLQEAFPKPGTSTGTTPPTGSTFSFANIASRGYEKNKFTSSSSSSSPPDSNGIGAALNVKNTLDSVATVKIPQDLWNPHENRDSSVFYIADPMERYRQVSSATAVKRPDTVDLHFQSTKTFGTVLKQVLPAKLAKLPEVWIITGTGHHVGSKTHQKGGGALERAVMLWLQEEGYSFAKGKDRNGLGGAILVKR